MIYRTKKYSISLIYLILGEMGGFGMLFWFASIGIISDLIMGIAALIPPLFLICVCGFGIYIHFQRARAFIETSIQKIEYISVKGNVVSILWDEIRTLKIIPMIFPGRLPTHAAVYELSSETKTIRFCRDYGLRFVPGAVDYVRPDVLNLLSSWRTDSPFGILYDKKTILKLISEIETKTGKKFTIHLR
ncbi:hypothetical protein [Leptospira alexanderi]|uniref:Uncharacterized protein n=1 Tax=Leptospira alexanderi serovar Manhao 3 str. L 60 TaxID=1049759 RepID=V6I7U4_9LEPT|nr:hypothetical protein [Leptospira alexanderi]EQA62809.1 hypothetical protein LEP1GSC062_1150 [Leptospira alexanderi serovar Manhao 3 str. L 60]